MTGNYKTIRMIVSKMAASRKTTAPKAEDEVSWPEEKQSSREVTQSLSDLEKKEDIVATPTDDRIIDETIISKGEQNEQDMEPQTPQQNQPSSFGLEMKEQPRGGRNWFLIIGIVLLIIALAGGGYFFYQNMNKSADEAEATPSESPFVVMASPAPSPSPVSLAPEIDRSEWTLEVLNGTGQSGLAADVKTKLEDMGYTVSKIGNAAETDTTKILVNKKMADQQDTLLEDLKDEFNVDEAGVLTDSSASARIIIGKDYLK